MIAIIELTFFLSMTLYGATRVVKAVAKILGVNKEAKGG